ncbi:MAG: LPS export ABC transporter permease LptF [Proteobacteria bacterium SG_bin9]|nr:MAG: LPS export ABC transporter permease LptF [Proteobacteria bacterium SG_bin9]
MGSIDKYIFRTTLGAFVMVLVSLTGVIWITQALRGIDLMTNQGQTILVFLGVTGLAIPVLALIIAPLALMIAVAYTLNKLATDSEVIVMNAAGLPPWGLFRPFLYASITVSLAVAALAFYIAPDGLRRLKTWNTEITADVMANILQPGRFTQLEPNLTIRIRERLPGGLLSGIFVDDRRDPKERLSIVADRGTVLKNDKGTFLILESGNLQRFEIGKRDPALVAFTRYAFDMSKFVGQTQAVTYNLRERYLTELLAPPADDPIYQQVPQRLDAELHDRLMSPIYPLVFVLLTFAFLGSPRTTRQSRSFSMVSAILAVLILRIGGYALSVLSTSAAWAVPLQYALLLATSGVCLWIILRCIAIEPPAKLLESVRRLSARLSRQPATA